MKNKKARILKGKQIKRETGLSHPIAMRIGKLIVQDKTLQIFDLFPAHIVRKVCSDKCCVSFHVIGPKGSLKV